MVAGLTQIDNNFFFPFFDNEPPKFDRGYFKVYNDGSHYIGSRTFKREELKEKRQVKQKEDKDILFDNLYDNAVKMGLKGGKMFEYIDSGIRKLYPDHIYDREYMLERIKKKKHNMYSRFKRFRRKAYLNKWNYFITFTYDDRKHSEETFRKKLRRCLSNLHTRRGWRYMGAFEHAPETNRLHFHGIFYIPDGQMIGSIREKKDYSTAQKKMQVTHENSFFKEYFGRNDFGVLNPLELRHGRTINYLLKYIEKQGERIVYSRGIPTEVYVEVSDKDVIVEMRDYIVKYILKDNLVDWERDILRCSPKQITLEFAMCNT